MTRKLKRTRQYELAFTLNDPAFLPLPRDGQRGWFLNRLMKEAGEELDHLHTIAPDFVPGADGTALVSDRAQGTLADDEIMEDWQSPVMARMAALATAPGGDILEVGFGRGIGSDFIQAHKPGSHTIIECNDSVVARFTTWRAARPDADIRLARRLWPERLPALGTFDGIFFHTYPLNEEEFVDQVAKSSTFAEHFFPHAAAHLRPGGVFVYLTMEMDSLSRAHQRALMKHSSSVSLSQLEGLSIPHDTRDAHWVNRMMMVAATR